MRSLSRLLPLMVLVCATIWAHAASAQITDVNSAINKAGRQRMLSQRMAKAFIQMALDVEHDKSKKILDGSIQLFEQQLGELRAFSPNPLVLETYIRLDQAWGDYKKLLQKKPSADEAQRVLEASETVLTLAHQGTVLLEKVSGKTQGRLVNVAGRQRMLSQRLAKFFQAMAYGVAPADAKTQMAQARDEFEKALTELSESPLNTPELKKQLDLGRQYWSFFADSLNVSGSKPPKSECSVVAVASERILEIMNDVTGLYEKLAAQ